MLSSQRARRHGGCVKLRAEHRWRRARGEPTRYDASCGLACGVRRRRGAHGGGHGQSATFTRSSASRRIEHEYRLSLYSGGGVGRVNAARLLHARHLASAGDGGGGLAALEARAPGSSGMSSRARRGDVASAQGGCWRTDASIFDRAPAREPGCRRVVDVGEPNPSTNATASDGLCRRARERAIALLVTGGQTAAVTSSRIRAARTAFAGPCSSRVEPPCPWPRSDRLVPSSSAPAERACIVLASSAGARPTSPAARSRQRRR